MSYEEEEMMDGEVPVAGGPGDLTVPLTKDALHVLRKCKAVGEQVLCTAEVGKTLSARGYVERKMVSVTMWNQEQGSYEVLLPRLILTEAGFQFLSVIAAEGYAEDRSFKAPA